MHERLLSIKTADGVMETFTTHPEKDGPFPAVILYMDIWGVRDELYDIARRIGTVGYYCVVPDLYYRDGKIRFDFRNDKNQTITAARLDEPTRLMVRKHWVALTNSMAMEDTGFILDYLKSGEPVRGGGVGVIGYCMGGRHVLCAAGLYSDTVVASVSIHGTRLLGDTIHGSAPLRLAHKFRGELYCGFAEHDEHMSIPQVHECRDLETVFSEVPVRCASCAIHGYSMPQRDVYDKQAAERDWKISSQCFIARSRPATPPEVLAH